MFSLSHIQYAILITMSDSKNFHEHFFNLLNIRGVMFSSCFESFQNYQFYRLGLFPPH